MIINQLFDEKRDKKIKHSTISLKHPNRASKWDKRPSA